ncbi:MAG: alpha/beta hydrolase, partial [Cyanobacteria bacterium]|nr:alpha/beta hydrolase [Cyanobacteriota bacterium]
MLEFIDLISSLCAKTRSIGRLLLVFCLVCICLYTSCLTTQALCPRKKGEIRVKVPLFYVTDRQLKKSEEGVDFGKQIVEPLDTITYGVTYEDSMSASIEEGRAAKLKEWGWTIFEDSDMPWKSDTYHKTANKDTKVFDSDFDKLVEELKKSLDQVDDKQVVVFVHGCCVDFRCSMRQAADLASSLKLPV